MIISVGYRVNSKKATKFRVWATSVLRQYLTSGVAVNQRRLEAMREKVSGFLSIPLGCVNVKATTTERLGFEGEGLGISAQAVCTLLGGLE